MPRSVMVGGRWVSVAEVVDTWQIEDEWWRARLARRYFSVLLGDGRPLTLFHDLVGHGWYLQRYPAPAAC